MTVRISILQSLDGGFSQILGLLLSCTILIGLGCDQTGMVADNDLLLTPLSSAVLSNGKITVELMPSSAISRGSYYPDPLDTDLRTTHLNAVGLWLAATTDVVRSNVATAITPTIPRIEFAATTGGSEGIYFVTRDTLDSNILNWPTELGAPVNFDGRPKLYGDQMAWGAFQPTVAVSGESAPLTDLRVGISLFVFNQGPLTDAFFVRYDIRNMSNQSFSELHVGFGGDVDLVMYNRSGPVCGLLDWWDNQTGYDLENHITYTYISPHDSDGDLPDKCYGTVVGFSILNMFSPGSTGENKLAHRIWRRDQHHSYPDFSGELLVNGEIVLFALQGLSPTGASMVDPETNIPTKFAFTGDPLTGAGWIDERHDVRSLQSIKPIDLGPGEMRSMTVVWLIADGDNLESGINLLKSQFAQVMSRRDLWDY